MWKAAVFRSVARPVGARNPCYRGPLSVMDTIAELMFGIGGIIALGLGALVVLTVIRETT